MRPRAARTLAAGLVAALVAAPLVTARAQERATAAPMLQYHPIRTDGAGRIVPWYSDDLGRAFDHVIRLVWKFWDGMAADRNGLPYYMNHQVWRPDLDDQRGLGGDQIQMALSSWALLYAYLGNLTTDRGMNGHVARHGRIVENMRFMADHYLTHGLSGPRDAWPNLPYPYNTAIYSGIYDGDMILGRGYTQPDKAGSLGAELIRLYKIAGDQHYLDAAVAIADTLAAKTRPGDATRSPLPFKVHARTGAVGKLFNKDGSVQESLYTTNWVGTLELFDELIRMKKGDGKKYQRAFDTILAWMKQYPLKTNRWGPFFEDIQGWSDTQINGVTFAQFIMERRELFPDWKADVRGIFDWVERELANHDWKAYGVTVINEQTAYRYPGNSHSSRQASAELRYAELTGDGSRKENARRQLAWATYSVDTDGKNRYFRDDVWLTDGYGDFVRHYLRAMAAAPELAPADQDHILRSTSVVIRADYFPQRIVYRTFDADATETLRLRAKPRRVGSGPRGERELPELAGQGAAAPAAAGWTWQPLDRGGVLRVRHAEADVTIALP